MIKKNNESKILNALSSQMELELLDALLQPEDGTYPWNPSDDESDDYFSELEQQFAMEELLTNEELTTKSQAFYGHVDSLWDQVVTNCHYKCNTNQSVVDHLQVILSSAFAANVPQGWLKTIAQKATEIFATQQSIGEELVQCVQSVLPTWDTDDLLVLARPFAYAMRSNESRDVKSVIDQVNNRDWETLSELEQAKVSVAIAYYAFRQIKNSQSEE